jgi:glucose dehydrogenase
LLSAALAGSILGELISIVDGGNAAMRSVTATVRLLGFAVLTAACSPDQQPAAPENTGGIDDAALVAAASNTAEWLTHGRDYAETRFSPLDQINAGNVGDLGVVWHYDTRSLRGLEASPLVHDGVLYATTRWRTAFGAPGPAATSSTAVSPFSATRYSSV